MTQTAWPFDNAATYEDRWRKMARQWLGTGVVRNQLNGLAVFGDSTGMQVKVPTGQAWVDGFFYENDAQVTLAIGANASGNPRIDRVVLHLDPTANTIDVRVLAGTPGVTPSPPALTQNATGVWEISLAQVAVANGAATIAAGNVTDERTLVPVQTGGSASVRKSADQTIATGTWVAVSWDTELSDTDGTHDTVTNNTRFTPKANGRYLISGVVSFAINSTGGRLVEIMKNGAPGVGSIVADIERNNAASVPTVDSVPFSVVADLLTTDYVEIYAQQVSGGNLAVKGGGTQYSIAQFTYLGGP